MMRSSGSVAQRRRRRHGMGYSATNTGQWIGWRRHGDGGCAANAGRRGKGAKEEKGVGCKDQLKHREMQGGG